MTTILAFPVDSTPVTAGTLDDLYTRYSCRLLAAAGERLAAFGPAGAELDEDAVQDVWLHVAEHGLPDHLRGLDALLAVLDRVVARIRDRRRELPAGLPHPARRVAAPVDLDVVADTVDVTPAPARPLHPATGSCAFDGLLRALPLAG
ncbi:hypothetical protein OG196_43620 (plasmid) [Kitasatospora purpeofusca]|uniref:hypothetical protein n=1 Tax=Kitasatospora purpeofusca TaxID=67352 RepID=UPI002E161F29|nr:hypothetical protein OG196_43620 [Kitasatospora purpeofusca]